MSIVDLSGAVWRKSSYTGNGSNGACVEVAWVGPAVAVRDSKSPATGTLAVPRGSWARFLRSV